MTIGDLKTLGFTALYETAYKNAVVIGVRGDDLTTIEGIDLNFAFSWSQSIEGHDFWSSLSRLYVGSPTIIEDIENHVIKHNFAHLSEMKSPFTDGVLVKRNGLFG